MIGRVFSDVPAARERVPLLFGIYGPSASGKTYSALRLAYGMRRVVGGEVFVIDTEHRRALHYADKFNPTFRHVNFEPPFSPDDYVTALGYCVQRGARVVVVDNMSHEHEGSGGVLDWHEVETERLSQGDPKKAERVKMLAWQKPKAARRRLVNAIVQLGLNAVFCFRAKEKLKILGGGKEPEKLGWMPIAGDEFIYEMTATALLLPGAGGVPCWRPPFDGEKAMIKSPLQFTELFRRLEGQPMSEEMGEAMARWAEGGRSPEFERLSALLRDARSLDGHDAARAEVQTASRRKALSEDELSDLKKLRDETRKALEAALLPPEAPSDAGQA